MNTLPLRRRQMLGWGVLALFALLGGLWLLRLDYAQKISTDVLDLVPADERAPELTLVRALASQAEARTMLIELTVSGEPAPEAAATRFVEKLRASPAFAEAVSMGDTGARDAIGRALFEQRLTLLFPRWLQARLANRSPGESGDAAEWLAEDSVAALGRFLETPEALAFQELVPADPLLLLPDAVERLKGGLALVQPATGSARSALVWARLAASPFAEEGQGPAFAALAQAAAETRAEFAGFGLAYTGVNRFAAASRERIEREVKWLNTASLIAVLAVALVFLRQVHRGLHLLPVVLGSTLGAWVATTLAFERVHILVFVFGSLLAGVAIDYGFYLFMQPPVRPDEPYADKVRRLAKPLLASCLTTVAGFALLLFSDLPFIRQLGVFVGSGLLCALAVAVIYFGTVKNSYLPARVYRGGSGRWRRPLRLVLLAGWFVALPGLAFLTWKDDIRELEIPSRALQREDARLRALFGQGAGGTMYVTYGRTAAEARAALENFETWIAEAGGGATTTVSLGAVIPTESEIAKARDFRRAHPDFPQRLRRALEAGGYEAAGFEPFFAAYAQNPETEVTAAVAALRAKLTGPTGLLMNTDGSPSWFVTLASGTPTVTPPADTHTVSVSQLQSLNRVFARYRMSALRLSAVGLAIVGVGVLLTYGVRDGVRIFAIPCGACLGLFGLLGWLGQPLNLFHLLGAFLGVCLTHNYSIFTATSAYRHEPPPVSVRLSALTAAASFGVLACSGIPVVRALGVTVAAMVVVALLMIEFEHLSGLGGKP